MGQGHQSSQPEDRLRQRIRIDKGECDERHCERIGIADNPRGSAVHAQTYPSRTITIVVTAAAGGVTDILARAVGARLAEKWGQQVVIENKGGGAHIVGAQQVANAAPDGHTMMFAEAGTYVINPSLYKDKQAVDVERDFIPVTGLVRIHHSVMVGPSLKADSVADIIEQARKKPGEITYGTAGIGSGPHVNVARFENAANVKLTAVHYRGAESRDRRHHGRPHQHDDGQRQPRAAAAP